MRLYLATLISLGPALGLFACSSSDQDPSNPNAPTMTSVTAPTETLGAMSSGPPAAMQSTASSGDGPGTVETQTAESSAAVPAVTSAAQPMPGGSQSMGTPASEAANGGSTGSDAAAAQGPGDTASEATGGLMGDGANSAGGSSSENGGEQGQNSETADATGAGGSGGSSQGAPYPAEVEPPVTDQSSTLPVAGPGGGYRVDGNIAYGELAQQRLDVMYPAGGGPDATDKSPGVIMFHGGGWIRGDKATMSSFYSRFLAHGFVVCSAEYRVADGDPDHIAPAAVEDALLAAKWFWDYLDYYNVDRERYVVTGASAGGHLALMVGMATPEAGLGPTSPQDFEIAAIVNGYGPSDVPDLLQRGTSWAVQWLPANTPDRDALAVRASPISYVRADIPPLLTVHGSVDTTVPLAQSQNLNDLLQAAGADADIHVVDGAGHGFSSPASAWPDAEQAMFGFLQAQGITE